MLLAWFWERGKPEKVYEMALRLLDSWQLVTYCFKMSTRRPFDEFSEETVVGGRFDVVLSK